MTMEVVVDVRPEEDLKAKLRKELEADYALFRNPTAEDADLQRRQILDSLIQKLIDSELDVYFCFNTLLQKRRDADTFPDALEDLVESLAVEILSPELKEVDANNLKAELEKDYDKYWRTIGETQFIERWMIFARWKNFLAANPQYSNYCVNILLEREKVNHPLSISDANGFLRNDEASLAAKILYFTLPPDPEYSENFISYLGALVVKSEDLIDADSTLTIELTKIRMGTPDINRKLKRILDAQKDPVLQSNILPRLLVHLAKLNLTPTYCAELAALLVGYYHHSTLNKLGTSNKKELIGALGYRFSPKTKAAIETAFIAEIRRQEKIDYTFNDLQQRTQKYLEQLKKEILADYEKIDGNVLFISKHPDDKILNIVKITGMEENKAEKLKDSINKKVGLYEDVQKLELTLADNSSPEITKEIKLQKYMNMLFENHGNEKNPSLAERIVKHSGNKTLVNAAIVAATLCALIVPGIVVLIYRGVKHRFPWEKEGKGAINDIEEFQHASRKAELAR